MSDFPEGFATDPGFDPAEDHIGPFYYRAEEGDAAYRCAFRIEAKNCNVNGFVHGGVLMSFADFAMCMVATDHYREESCTTVSFNADFVAAATVGDVVECVPRIVKQTGSLAFISAELKAGQETVMVCSSVLKRIRKT